MLKNILETQDMTQGKPVKLIFVFAIPLLIGNLFRQFYGIAEAVIVGRFVDEHALAVLGIAGTIISVINECISGICSGFAITICQQYGLGNEKKLKNAISNALMLCVIISGVITVLLGISCRWLLELIHTPYNLRVESYCYMMIIFGGITCMTIYNMMIFILRALGDAISPFLFLIGSSVLNIVLDIIAVKVCSLGVIGAAWAMVATQGISGIAYYAYAAKKYPVLRLRKKDFLFDKELLIRQVYMGFTIAIQALIANAGVLILQRTINQQGVFTVVAYTTTSRILNFLVQIPVTIGLVLTNYTGQNFGAKCINRIKDGVKICMVAVTICTVISILVMNIWGESICVLFLKEPYTEIISECIMCFRIYSGGFLFLSVLQVYRSALYGMGKGGWPFASGIFEFLIRCLCASILPIYISDIRICIANPLAWFGASVLMIFVYYWTIKKQVSLQLIGQG